MTIGTVTLTNKQRAPTRYTQERRQHSFVKPDSTMRVRNVGPTVTLVRYDLRSLTVTDAENLRAFIEDDAEFRLNTFTVTDDQANSYTARWWGSKQDYVEKVGRLFDVGITFRVEGSWS